VWAQANITVFAFPLKGLEGTISKHSSM
jgi:hypothetical protein